MTIVKPIQIQAANNALEAWNSLGVQGRAELLENAVSKFSGAQASMAQWQLDNARHEIGEAVVLPGPTGESNVLSTHGRGAFLITAQDSFTSDSALVALVGQTFAALVAGNPVITVGQEGQTIMDKIAPFVAEGVIQNVATSAEESIVAAEDLAGIATLCDADHAQALYLKLANKSGLLCQLVEENDVDALPVIGAPHYILRFVTEQTVSNNTTAIGGNATLLELGSKEE
ncbi:1-pyrroline-5-carboxylate dehydrogenase [Marinomonas piezotolerans]|uniref:1-pyrroline-5-carboxylate dehydrogenase n=1 Tax=Marinomonas piezotolerans TaxID=2213058 RepID=A0A370UAT4_9GAMM|nr:1-pyrroline-5-carboxylate dehydrogenase [Marinomonas piezotolerans]RDL44892.1 1-pyrroline-5-carboxylate dehydrogenase [Marinomonas piezotolerans]